MPREYFEGHFMFQECQKCYIWLENLSNRLKICRQTYEYLIIIFLNFDIIRFSKNCLDLSRSFMSPKGHFIFGSIIYLQCRHCQDVFDGDDERTPSPYDPDYYEEEPEDGSSSVTSNLVLLSLVFVHYIW